VQAVPATAAGFTQQGEAFPPESAVRGLKDASSREIIKALEKLFQ